MCSLLRATYIPSKRSKKKAGRKPSKKKRPAPIKVSLLSCVVCCQQSHNLLGGRSQPPCPLFFFIPVDSASVSLLPLLCALFLTSVMSVCVRSLTRSPIRLVVQ